MITETVIHTNSISTPAIASFRNFPVTEVKPKSITRYAIRYRE